MSSASVAKHPIHPMLIVFPVGLWIFSLVCDVVYVAGWGGESWRQAALYTIGGGIVGALLAAIPGLVDLLGIEERNVRRIGVFHMVLNLGAVAVFAVDFGLRFKDLPGARPPVLLSVLGILIIAVSGWLGGELVYVHGVGVHGGGPASPPR